MTATDSSLRAYKGGKARWWGSGRRVNGLIIVSLSLFSFVMIYPFLWLIFSSFKTRADIIALPLHLLPRPWTGEGFNLIWNQTNLPRAYLNSLGVSTATLFSVLFTSSLGGYVFARLEFPGRKLLFYFVLSTTMVPFVTLLIPLYLVMLKLGLLNSYVGLWLPGAVSSFGIFLCRQFIYGIPRDLYESAKIDGCADFAIYRRIVVPLIKPVMSLLAIFTFLGSFNSYLWPLVILNNQNLYTLPLVLAQASSSLGTTNYQEVMAGALLASIPTIVVYLIFQRNFVQGIALTGIKT